MVTLSPTTCGRCVHFENNPGAIEAALPGIRSMGSGFASVRAQDGLCRRHAIYLPPADSCPEFTARDVKVTASSRLGGR